MVHGKDDKLLKIDNIDKWLEEFFLDPLTSYLDEVTFRIDLFETADEFIVEALFLTHQLKEIIVNLDHNKIMIQVSTGKSEIDTKKRIIPFPFPVIEHDVSAVFHDDILEVYISKNRLCNGINRKIPIVNIEN